MITGSCSAAGEAKIPLALFSTEKEVVQIEAVVDTGFTGFLTLPSGMISELDLEWMGREQAILGDGSATILDVFIGKIPWEGEMRVVEVIGSESVPLAGMGLLSGQSLEIDVIEGGRVSIRRLQS